MQLPNLRFSACPNTAVFGGGCKYILNSTVINNCPGTYYEHAMANLWQKQDGSGETAGSNALLTRDKRLRAPMETAHQSEDANLTHDNQAETIRCSLMGSCVAITRVR